MEGIEHKKSKGETASQIEIGDDVLQNILSRLPARPFAAAACVNKSWNRVSTLILSRPKLASAISLNPNLKLAMQQVLDKVLIQPIRPHFAIVNVGRPINLGDAFKFMVKKLGSNTPIVVSFPGGGIIGRDAITDEFKEVQWGDDIDGELLGHSEISLTIGYLPGVKVDAIPLLNHKKASQEKRIDKFVMDIKNFTMSVSGSTSPIGIIMFGGENIDQKPVVEKLDHAMPMETIIVGDARSPYMYNGGQYSRNILNTRRQTSKFVALVFANDRNKDHGIGSIRFHAAISEGVSVIGPKYKASSVRVVGSETWLTARREGQNDAFDGHQLLNHINDQLENDLPHIDRFDPELYIGVTKRRNYCIGSEKPRLMTSLALHEVIRGDDPENGDYLYTCGDGIKSGDNFQFYVADPETAATTCDKASRYLRNLKSDWEAKSVKEEPFGGFILSCCGRGMSFFGQANNVDSSPLLSNFPEIPVAGMFCAGEIARSQENTSVRRSLHVYSTAYLVMTYTPGIGIGGH